VSQNGTGITAFGSPGNGLGFFTARGFAGQNSIQTLFDGTRLYVPLPGEPKAVMPVPFCDTASSTLV
jgi:hypothetical protein